MMGIHVANSFQNKVYFIVDPRNARETGALMYPTGSVSFVNFWGWVSANPEIQKLEENEFQQLIWNDPLPQDEEMWESVFFSRTTPLSGIIDPKLLVNIGGSNQAPKQQVSKMDLAKQVMDRSSSDEQR